MNNPSKTIPEARDRLQSNLLAWIVGCALAIACIPSVSLAGIADKAGRASLHAIVLSLTFAIIVWALRAATPMASFCGGMICLLITTMTEYGNDWSEIHSGLVPLLALFLLTFAATKTGKSRKHTAEQQESKRGRNAAQIIANLGAAALACLYGCVLGIGSHRTAILLLACLAEATADTVSSEIGSAFGGQPFLVTTFCRVPAGTDGAVSLLGTLAGSLAAAIVVIIGMGSLGLTWQEAALAFTGGFAGLWFDSLLGATLERRGWLGNDLVNFTSTVFAGLLAYLLATHLNASSY